MTGGLLLRAELRAAFSPSPVRVIFQGQAVTGSHGDYFLRVVPMFFAILQKTDALIFGPSVQKINQIGQFLSFGTGEFRGGVGFSHRDTSFLVRDLRYGDQKNKGQVC